MRKFNAHILQFNPAILVAWHCIVSFSCPNIRTWKYIDTGINKTNILHYTFFYRKTENIIPTDLPIVQEVTHVLREWGQIWKNMFKVNAILSTCITSTFNIRQHVICGNIALLYQHRLHVHRVRMLTKVECWQMLKYYILTELHAVVIYY